MSAAGPRGGFGVVGLGDPGSPSLTRPRPDLCAGLGHPGTTFNVAMGLTWCLCGAEIYDGDQSVPHVACCGGPLVSPTAAPRRPVTNTPAPSARRR